MTFGALQDTARAQTLREALAKTYLNNPEILAQRASVKSTVELIPQALADWFRPDVTATVTGTKGLEYDKESTKGSTDSYTDLDERIRDLSGELELSMELYSGGASAADIRYARASYRAARATLEQTEQTVLARTATRYLDLVRAEKLLNQAKSHGEELKSVLDRVEALLAKQRATIADRAEIALEIAAAKALVETRNTALRSARSAYEETVGEAPDRLNDWPDLPETTRELTESLDLARRRNPGIIGAQAEVEARQAALGSNRAELLPTLTFYATATREYEKIGVTGTSVLTEHIELTDYSVALQLSIPLYSGGSRSSKIRAARMDVSESRLKLTQVHQAVEENVRDARSRFLGAMATIEWNKEQLENANILLAGRKRQFQRRAITIDIMVDAHAAVNAAQEALIEQQLARRVALVDQLLAEGLFGVTSLDLGVAPIDVDGYARRVEKNSWIPWEIYKP